MNAGKSSSYCGLSYNDGMAMLNEGVKGGQIQILTYDIKSCGPGVISLDIEGEFEDILDKLGYNRELVYSEDSMQVWFGIYTQNPQITVDEIVREVRDIEHLSGLSVTISQQTFVI